MSQRLDIPRICRVSWQGACAVFRSEVAFRVELTLGLIFIPLAFLLPLELIWKALLVTSMLGIFAAEFLNTAIETVVDLVSPDHHPLAGKAKDIGSALVFLSFIQSGIVWVLAIIALRSS